MFLILHNVCYCFYTLYRLAFMKLNLFENWKHTTQCQQLACHPMVLAMVFSGLMFWFIFQWRNFYWLGFLETQFFANSTKICFAILRIATFAYYYYSSLWLSIEKTNKKKSQKWLTVAIFRKWHDGWLAWMTDIDDWHGWMTWMNGMGLAWTTGMDDWHGWLAWTTGMDDWYGWLAWMTGMDDWHGWLA